MEISKKLKDEIWEYCRLNDITDVDGFINRMTQQGYSVEKFGTAPIKISGEPEIIEKEVIKEVEKIVEVEKVVEVIREVEVEKIVEVPIDNTDYIDELVLKIHHLEESHKTLEKDKLEMLETDGTPKLLNRIKNLETELELEKNRHKTLPKGKIIAPKKRGLKDIIKYIKNDDEDIYGED